MEIMIQISFNRSRSRMAQIKISMGSYTYRQHFQQYPENVQLFSGNRTTWMENS